MSRLSVIKLGRPTARHLATRHPSLSHLEAHSAYRTKSQPASNPELTQQHFGNPRALTRRPRWFSYLYLSFLPVDRVSMTSSLFALEP